MRVKNVPGVYQPWRHARPLALRYAERSYTVCPPVRAAPTDRDRTGYEPKHLTTNPSYLIVALAMLNKHSLQAKLKKQRAAERARAHNNIPRHVTPTQRNDDENMSDASSSLPDTSPSPMVVAERAAASALLVQQKRELLALRLHFSKIVRPFDDTHAAYLGFMIRFKAELESHNLSHVIARESDGSAYEDEQQRTVWDMIQRSVPATILTGITDALVPHTGIAAWTTLRLRYIGDEATFQRGLETKFTNFRWIDGESFGDLEVRFGGVVSEMAMAGMPAKADSLKKDRFMAALEHTTRKDAHGASVFSRFHVVHTVHRARPFQEWMTELRLEAQQIRDALEAVANERRSTKRAHEDNHSSAAPQHQLVPISYVNPTTASRSLVSSSNIRRVGSSGSSGREVQQVAASKVCFNFSNGGSCRYGSACKFSHDPATAAGRAGGTSSGGGQRAPCRLFQQGRCNYGNRCRFMHTGPTPPAGSHSGYGSFSMPTSAPNRDPNTVPVRQMNHSYHAIGQGLGYSRENPSSGYESS